MRATLGVAMVVLSLAGMCATAVWAQGVPVPDTVSVNINVPDGGLGVSVPQPLRVVGPDAGAVQVVVSVPDGGLLISLPEIVRVSGQSAGDVQVSVTIPDGGLPVLLPQPFRVVGGDGGVVQVAAPDVVRVVGSTFGEVAISGTVSLSSPTLGALGNRTCTLAESVRIALSNTATIVPAVPFAGRSSITVINADTSAVERIACRVDPGDGGVPDCATPGRGLTVFPNGGTLTFPVRDTNTVRCIACTGGTTVVEYTEEACVVP